MDFRAEDFVQIREEDVKATKPVVMIKGLPSILDEKDYKKYFSQYGELKGMSLLKTKKGNSKGILFVKFADCDIARICAETLDRHILEGKLLKTKLFDSKVNGKLKSKYFQKNDDAKKPKKNVITDFVVEQHNLKMKQLKEKLDKYNINFTFPQ